MVHQSDINRITDEARDIMSKLRSYTRVVKEEHNLTKQYEDREIFELLQNIDDAYTDSNIQEREASFVLDGDVLIVSNNGVPFTVSTLERLCQGGVSDKSAKYIGCKGIGFRSVLNWTHEIEIFSGEISVRFSKEYAQKQYDSLLLNSESKDKILEQKQELINLGLDPSYPILRAPECIEGIEQDFDTIINLKKLSAKTIKNIKADIRDIEKYKYILLFLPNINKITFILKDDNESIVFERKVSGNIRTIELNGEPIGSFYFDSTEEKLAEKYMNSDIVKLAVAIPVEETENTYKMYTFFPIMNVDSPFPALLHATFCLSDNRNNLDSSKPAMSVNTDVFKRLQAFYVKTVSNLNLRERAIRLLMPCGYTTKLLYHFPDDLKNLECTNVYYDICREYPIFYTINGDYLSANDNPIILSDVAPHAFQGRHFAKIIKHLDSNNLQRFAGDIVQYYNNEEYLFDATNASSAENEWSSETRTEVFRWWHNTRYSLLPNLLKDRNGAYITDKNKTYFLSGGDTTKDAGEDDTNSSARIIEELPLWAKIAMLDKDDENNLHRVFKTEIDAERQSSISNSKASWKRILPSIIKNVSLREQSSRKDMISPVNDSVGENYEHAQEFLKWLSAIWPEIKQGDSTVKSISYVVPTADGKVVLANKAYLDENYGNKVGKIFFENDANFSPIAKIDFDDDIDAIAFLKDIGVLQYPVLKKEEKKIFLWDQSDTHEFVKRVLEVHPIFDQTLDIDYFVTNFLTITDLKRILSNPNIDYTVLLQWIFKDANLKSAIEHDVQPSECKIQYHVRKKKSPWTHNNEWNLPSYIKYVFSYTEWFEINGVKKAPKDIFISNNNYLNDFGFTCISETEIQDIAQKVGNGCTKESLRSLIVTLGAKTSYLDFTSNDFYHLLLELPKNCSNSERLAKAKKISRDIYRAIIDNNDSEGNRIKTQFCIDSKNKQQFQTEGMVLAKDENNSSSFHPVRNVYFSSSAVMNVDNKYMIDIPARRGKQNDFKEILFVKPYEYNYSIKEINIADCNKDFQDDLASFIPCLISYKREKKDKVCKLVIELIESATIINTKDGHEYACTDNYTLLKDNDRHRWYICIGRNYDYRSLEKEKIADALVQVFYVLLDFPSKDFLGKVEQLFIYSEKQRKHLIEQDLGSTDEIELTMAEIKKSEELTKCINDLFTNYTTNETVESLLKEIDWYNPTSLQMQGKIVKLLKLSNTTLSALCQKLGKDIRISDYNRNLLTQTYKQHEDRAMEIVYNSIINQLERHTEFLMICNKLHEAVNSYKCDYNDIEFNADVTYSKIEEKWILDNNLNSLEEISKSIEDIRKIYTDNYELVRTSLGTDDAISFSNDNGSLLFFEDDNLLAKAQKYIEKDTENTQAATDVNDSLIQQLADVVGRTDIKQDLDSGRARCTSSSSRSGAVTRRTLLKQERKNAFQGSIAEYLVIQKLANKDIVEVCKFFDDTEYDIYWMSGAAKNFPPPSDSDCAISYISTETNDAAGYDIKLVSKDRSKSMFIEVKSSTESNCSFIMSSNEFEKATRLNSGMNCYRVVFVSNLKANDLEHCKPEITFIDMPVEEAFKKIPTEYNLVYIKQNN